MDSSLNYINELVLAVINNESCNLNDMLKQKDKSDFIKAIIKEIDTQDAAIGKFAIEMRFK